jgi:hypothetical protein
MLFVDIDKRQIVPGTREPATDDAADRPDSDYQNALAHEVLLGTSATICDAFMGVNVSAGSAAESNESNFATILVRRRLERIEGLD